jgi:hypothetical protein
LCRGELCRPGMLWLWAPFWDMSVLPLLTLVELCASDALLACSLDMTWKILWTCAATLLCNGASAWLSMSGCQGSHVWCLYDVHVGISMRFARRTRKLWGSWSKCSTTIKCLLRSLASLMLRGTHFPQLDLCSLHFALLLRVDCFLSVLVICWQSIVIACIYCLMT